MCGVTVVEWSSGLNVWLSQNLTCILISGFHWLFHGMNFKPFKTFSIYSIGVQFVRLIIQILVRKTWRAHRLFGVSKGEKKKKKKKKSRKSLHVRCCREHTWRFTISTTFWTVDSRPFPPLLGWPQNNGFNGSWFFCSPRSVKATSARNLCFMSIQPRNLNSLKSQKMFAMQL